MGLEKKGIVGLIIPGLGADLTQVSGQVAFSAVGHYPILSFQERLASSPLGLKNMSVLPGCLPDIKAVIFFFLLEWRWPNER